MADWTDCDRVCIACKTVQKTEWCECGCPIPTRPTTDELLKRIDEQSDSHARNEAAHNTDG